METGNFIVESLSKENVDAWVQLVLSLWEECDPLEERAYYSGLISSDRDFCCLVRNEERYLGFIHGSLRSEYVEGADVSPVAYLEAIYVVPDFQKKGIARLLLGALENWARSKNVSQLASDTERSNTSAIAFHQQLGFTEVARIVCFVKDL